MSCSGAAAGVKPKSNVVRVNGAVIARETIAREAQHHPAATPAAAFAQAARALAIRQLLLDEAQRLELSPQPLEDDEGRRETDEEALVRQVVEREVRLPRMDEATCRRYFEQNRRKFRSPDIFEAAHILFAAAPGDRAGRAKAKGDAAAAIEVLASEPGRFSELARAHSACPSAQQGGNLGQIVRGATTAEFDKAMAALEQGTISRAPVETRYGFHVVWLQRRVEGADLPYEAVRDKISAYLADAVERRALAQYVAILAGRAEIAGVDFAAAKTPLVQ
ncbi:MAG TPA: peptidylprolyl isomerase [Roseiarcus sp.]|nr:peptidylprolyl isomerase [Roseiarcus sp.]